MNTDNASVSPAAAALLKPMLDPSEIILWAERPDLARATVSSVRAFVATPVHWIPLVLLTAFVIWRVWFPVEGSIFDWVVGLGVLALAGPALIDLVAALLVAAPFFTPMAYGATHGYIVLVRGPLFRRLLRTPISIVKDVNLRPWSGHEILVFDMHEGQKPTFSFLHSPDPPAALARIRPLVAQMRD